jgi:hypothetical protein
MYLCILHPALHLLIKLFASTLYLDILMSNPNIKLDIIFHFKFSYFLVVFVINYLFNWFTLLLSFYLLYLHIYSKK